MIHSAGLISRRIGVVAIAAGALALVLSGCATSPGGTATGNTGTGSTETAAPTDGATGDSVVGTWVLEKDFPTAPNTPFLTLSETGDWTGSDGCNGGGGTWKIDSEGALTVTAGASTLMACDGAPLPNLFANAAAAVRAGDELTLTGRDGTVTYLELGESDFSTTN